MEQRKLQLVAGSTYTISLPKQWVIRNNLKVSDHLTIYEKSGKSLIVSVEHIKDENTEIKINVDKYSSIEEIIFSVYYMGVERIDLWSEKSIIPEKKKIIRRAVRKLSGVEIIFESKKMITLNLLLDKSKLNINQILYRISLIILQSIDSIDNGDEIEANEKEIDRLFHLSKAILSLSMRNPGILESSGVDNLLLIPSYNGIAKKFEKIHDDLYRLVNYYQKSDIGEIIKYTREVTETTRDFILKPGKPVDIESEGLEEKADTFGNSVAILLRDLVTHTRDLEKHLVQFSFYRSIEKDK